MAINTQKTIQLLEQRIADLEQENARLKQAEDTLRKLSRAVEQSPVTVVITNVEGVIEYVNPKFTLLTGYTEEEAAGQNPRILQSGLTPHTEYAKLWETITDGDVWHGEFTNKKKNGELYWESATISPIRNNRGEITHFVAVKEDVTERKQMEANLKESETRYRELFEGLPIPVIIHQNHIIQLVNPAFARLMGGVANKTPEAFIGRSIQDFIPPSNNENLQKRLTILYEEQAETPPGEYLFINDDGESIPVLSQGIPVTYNGQPAAQTVFINIAYRKQSEQKIQQLNERFTQIFHSSPAIVVLTNLADGRFIEVNRAFEEVFGYNRDEVLGKTTTGLNIWTQQDDRKGLINQLMKERSARNVENTFKTKNGDLILLLGSYEIVSLDDGDAILSALIDITEYKHLEAESRRAEILQVSLDKEKEVVALKDRFISIVSHEFRTPLALIQTSTDLISRYGERMSVERRQQALEQIQQQVFVLTQMIDGVLAISRTQTGKIEFMPQAIQLEPFCHTIFEQIQFTDTDNHHFKFIGDSLDQPVMIDGKLLKHILNNLLTNAIKYSPEKSVITFELQHDDQHVIIMIHDEGIGIPEEDITRLFDPFHRASNAGKAQGSGLGLSIVKEYVELHGGIITVISEMGKGSTFTISLPRQGIHL